MNLRTAAFEQFVGPAARTPQLWRLFLGAAIVLACSLGGTALIISLMWLGFGGERTVALVQEMATLDTPTVVLLMLLTFAGMAAGPVLAVRLVHRRPVSSLLGRLDRVFRDFLRAVVVVAVANALDLLVWSFFFDAVPNLSLGRWLLFLPLALAGILLQTLAEEMVFRGYLMQQLAARFCSARVWMLVPALLFGAAHFAPGTNGDNALIIVGATALFGVIAADLVRVSGSLGAAWGFHFANNVMAILVISANGTITGLSLFRTPYAASDTLALPLQVALDLATMILAWAVLRRVVRR